MSSFLSALYILRKTPSVFSIIELRLDHFAVDRIFFSGFVLKKFSLSAIFPLYLPNNDK